MEITEALSDEHRPIRPYRVTILILLGVKAEGHC